MIRNRSDLGAGKAGAGTGIEAVEIAAFNAGDDFFGTHEIVEVQTYPMAKYQAPKHPFAKRIETITKVFGHVREAVANAMADQKFPVIISGDHSSAAASIQGVKRAIGDKTLGVIWIDAHADLHSPYSTPSGNIHGMPLNIVTDVDNTEIHTNNLPDDTIKAWNDLRENKPALKPEHLVFFGVRSTEKQEDYLIDKYNIRNITVDEVNERGVEDCVNEAFQILADCDAIYVSFDVDAMDPDEISYGTGTPVKEGFSEKTTEALLKAISRSEKLVAFEMVEINPLLDKKGNAMAEAAFRLLKSFVSYIKSR